jgi:hypothetical protein
MTIEIRREPAMQTAGIKRMVEQRWRSLKRLRTDRRNFIKRVMLHESRANGLGREERGDVVANADPEPQH